MGPADVITRSALKDVFAGTADIAGLIHLSHHCVERYRERFKPELSPSRARLDLYRRMKVDGIFTLERPRWILMGGVALGWVVIDDDIALPIREDTSGRHSLVAVTALYRLQ